jgi:hypothetical protein
VWLGVAVADGQCGWVWLWLWLCVAVGGSVFEHVANTDFKVLYPTLSDFDIRFYMHEVRGIDSGGVWLMDSVADGRCGWGWLWLLDSVAGCGCGCVAVWLGGSVAD